MAVPSLGRYMMTPRSLGMLALALLVAAAFGWLGQWQLDRAVMTAPGSEAPQGEPKSLEGSVLPNAPLRDSDSGALMTVNGSFVAADYSLVGGRQHNGQAGLWVVGHFLATSGSSVAVALGWTPDTDTDALARTLDRFRKTDQTTMSLEGWLIPSQAPVIPDDPQSVGGYAVLPSLAIAELANMWSGFESPRVYTGYLIARDAPSELQTIAPPPRESSWELNWLNIFYAAEWIVFAGFALFFWYRLVRDSWLRQRENS